MRQKAIVDSIKAAGTDIQNVSALISNNPGNRVEHINVSDSDGYITVVVRVHVTEASVIPALSPLPIVKIEVRDIVADGASTIAVPPIPPPIVEADTIVALSLLAVIKLNTKGVPVVKMDMTDVPPLTYLKPEIDALPLIAVKQYRSENIVVSKVGVTKVPDLPDIEPEPEALAPSATILLSIKHRSVSKIDTVAIAGFVDFNMSLMGMHLSVEGYDLLEKLEGFSPELYSLKDGGFTIGFGFFIPYSEGRKWNKGVTWEEAERMIRQKVPVYEDQVKQYINVALTQEEFDALTMLAYNLGGFSKATSIVNDINTNAGFDKLQKDWMRFVHSKAPGVMKGLMNRRKDELQVRYEANYQPERKIQVLKK